MALDYGLFEALTGPMQAAGNIQSNRDAQRLQQLQLQEQETQLQLREQDRQQQLQSQLNLSNQAAKDAIFTKNKYRRQIDSDDYSAWHKQYSGWSDIESILKQYDNVPNARLHGGLDEALAKYKQRVQTPDADPEKGNPILHRVNQNFASIEQYQKYALDKDGYAKFLTSNSHKRFDDWQKGLTDIYKYTGPRGDYLANAGKGANVGDNIDLDEVIASNYMSITNDMEIDLGVSKSTFTDIDIRNWVSTELQYQESGGIGRFGDEAIFGTKEIDTEYSTELVRSLDVSNQTGVYTGSDYFKVQDNNKAGKGYSFNELFDETSSEPWSRLGGYDKNTRMHSTKGIGSPFSKGMQLVGSGRIFANNPNLESAVTKAWAGVYEGDEENPTSRYNTKSRKINDINTTTLYDRRGHKITDQDVASTVFTGANLWQESETMDLRLTGYHVALEGKNKDGDTFLLTDVSSEDDMNKMKEQYGDIQFDYVMVAELIDDDLGPDDAYYRKVDMEDPNLQATINKSVDSTDLNNVLNQMATYEEEIAHKQYQNKRKLVDGAKIQKQMNLPDDAAVSQVVNAYDQSLTVGLATAGIPSKKIEQAIPMIIADLYLASQEQKEFPVVVEKDAQGNITKQANTPYELMAYQAQQLKIGLTSGNPQFELMLEAIKTGQYNKYRESTSDTKAYNQGKNLARTIQNYYNNK